MKIENRGEASYVPDCFPIGSIVKLRPGLFLIKVCGSSYTGEEQW